MYHNGDDKPKVPPSEQAANVILAASEVAQLDLMFDQSAFSSTREYDIIMKTVPPTKEMDDDDDAEKSKAADK